MKWTLPAALGAAILFAAGCVEVKVDETSVFAPVPFDAELAARTHEAIEGEGGFASADKWTAAWAERIANGQLTAPAPAFVSAKVEHGRLNGAAGSVAWSMIWREGANRPLVVKCGGNASTRQHTGFIHAVTALDHGDVLLFDYPGSGETGGEATPQRFEALREDLTGLIREKAAARTLILWGHSLGGFVCSQLAEQLPETAGVIIETSARNAREVAKAWTPWYAGPFVSIKIGKGLDAYDNANSLRGFKGPVLVLGATEDQTLPVQLARSLSKALNEEGVDTTYVEFREGGHSSLAGQGDFPRVISDFFAKVKPGA